MMRNFAHILLGISAIVLCFGRGLAECPNACSGHGDCREHDSCVCHKGWIGHDCSERLCPQGLSFIDTPLGDLDGSGDVETSCATGANCPFILTNTDIYPGGTCENPLTCWDTGHSYQECSAKGKCDRSTGECVCEDGYYGSACQRSMITCVGSDKPDCGAHGQCLNIKDIAKSNNFDSSIPLADTTGHRGYDYVSWDATKIYGCQCDPWYWGIDCTQRKCPVGVDPLYSGSHFAKYSVFKLVVFPSDANDAYSNIRGWFHVAFFDVHGAKHISPPISCAVGTDFQLKKDQMLEALNDLPKEVVRMESDDVSFFLSEEDDAFVYIMKFRSNPGPLMLMEVDTSRCVVYSSGKSVSSYVTVLEQGEFSTRFPDDIKAITHLSPGLMKVSTSEALVTAGIPPVAKVGSWMGLTDPTKEGYGIAFKHPVGIQPAGKICSACVFGWGMTSSSTNYLLVDGMKFPITRSKLSEGSSLLVPLGSAFPFCAFKTKGAITLSTDFTLPQSVQSGFNCAPSAPSTEYGPVVSVDAGLAFIEVTAAAAPNTDAVVLVQKVSGNPDWSHFCVLSSFTATADTTTYKLAPDSEILARFTLCYTSLLNFMSVTDISVYEISTLQDLYHGREMVDPEVYVGKVVAEGTSSWTISDITVDITGKWTDVTIHATSPNVDSSSPLKLVAGDQLAIYNRDDPGKAIACVVTLADLSSGYFTGIKTLEASPTSGNYKYHLVAESASTCPFINDALTPDNFYDSLQWALAAYKIDTTTTFPTGLRVIEKGLYAQSTIVISAAVPGDRTLTASTVAFGSIKQDDLLYMDGITYEIQFVVDKDIRLKSPYAGFTIPSSGSLTTTAYILTPTNNPSDNSPYQYVGECSLRGICDYQEGICKCFRGYTNDNCDTQNTLSVGA